MKPTPFGHFLLLILLPLAGFSSFSQTITISGKVTDSLKNPLAHANVLAIPESDDETVRFAITEANGHYKLRLSKSQTYTITISFLGFTSQTSQISGTDKDQTKDFILHENPDQLKEIILNYVPPIVVKKDTITYDVGKFVTGEERKLRDALKTLPGVEVDRIGNVTVQGKKVTRVLVENKTFFTGDSKLAVNNIPADAVDKVEIIDDYNDVPMLKGLQDSDDMAMNIKLKEDKKKFVFGDVEGGAGIKNRYLLHPSLFYYSPKTNVNFIGDLNNQGIKSFSFRDYMEFEGGFGKLISNSGSYFDLFRSDFAQFLNNQDFKSNTNQFGALNIRQSITKNTDISGYAISSNSKTDTERQTLNNYLSSNEPYFENRTQTSQLHDFFTIGKLTIDYDPSLEEDFAYNSFIKVTNTDRHGRITTLNPFQDNTINTLSDITAVNLKQNLTYSRKLSRNHTMTVEATYNFQNDKPFTEWLTNQKILQGLMPLEDDVIYTIVQTKRSKSHGFNAVAKDYWVLNNFNHIYASIGTNLTFSNFYNNDRQLLSDGTSNNFNSAGFGNDLDYQFVDNFIGLEYKFQIGIATFKPMLFTHFYTWNTKQPKMQYSTAKTLLLPQFTVKIDFNSSEKINFNYRLNARFPGIDQLANNFILSNFNSIFKGNSTLENQLYHSANLSYHKFSLFRNLNLNINTSFNKKTKHYKNLTQLEGIEQFSTLARIDQPEHNWNINIQFSKKINKIRYKLQGNYRYNDFYQLLNNSSSLNISKSMSATLSAETFFKKFPNIELGHTKDYNNYRAPQTITTFENDKLFINLQHTFLRNFIFKADYALDRYRNKANDAKNIFDTANASLFYQKEDSPWGFEISATNLFETSFRQQNAFSSFLISDTKTFILPRIIMFKVAYKL